MRLLGRRQIARLLMQPAEEYPGPSVIRIKPGRGLVGCDRLLGVAERSERTQMPRCLGRFLQVRRTFRLLAPAPGLPPLGDLGEKRLRLRCSTFAQQRERMLDPGRRIGFLRLVGHSLDGGSQRIPLLLEICGLLVGSEQLRR